MSVLVGSDCKRLCNAASRSAKVSVTEAVTRLPITRMKIPNHVFTPLIGNVDGEWKAVVFSTRLRMAPSLTGASRIAGPGGRQILHTAAPANLDLFKPLPGFHFDHLGPPFYIAGSTIVIKPN